MQRDRGQGRRSAQRAAYRLVAFDLDGTLLPGTSVSAELGRCMGQEAELAVLESRYARGEISNKEVATCTAEAFAGVRLQDIEAWLETCPQLTGIQATAARLRSRGVAMVVATVTWSFAAEFFARKFMMEFHCGTVMRRSGDVLLGSIETYFDEHDKARFVVSLCERLGIDLALAAAVGDARSDIPLFRKVGLAIALNGSEAARAAAHVQLQSADLGCILPHVLPSSTCE